MNFIDKYVAYASRLTEAPKIFHYYMGYMLLSQVVGKKAICNYADYNCGPNLWMVMIGPSSMARKSTAWKIGINLLREVYLTDTGPSYQLPNDGSYESWIEALHAKLDNDGVAQGLMVFDEYKRLHDWISRDYSAPLETLFTSAYDQTDIKRRVGTREKAREFYIPSPYLNIVAASTLTWFSQSVTQKQIMSGFIPRFNIIFSDERGNLLPRRPLPDPETRDGLVADLKRFMCTQYGEYTYDDEAGKIYDAYYEKVQTKILPKASDSMAPFYNRRLADVHKFAMLNCIMRHDKTRVMNKADVEAAINEAIKNVLMFTEGVINDKMTFTPFQENRNRVYDLILKFSKSNDGAPHSKILRASKLDKQTFDRVVQTLDEEEVVSVKRVSTAGRPAVFYKTIDKGEELDEPTNHVNGVQAKIQGGMLAPAPAAH